MCYGCMAFAAGLVFGMSVARKLVEEEEESVDPASIGDEDSTDGSDKTE